MLQGCNKEGESQDLSEALWGRNLKAPTEIWALLWWESSPGPTGSTRVKQEPNRTYTQPALEAVQTKMQSFLVLSGISSPDSETRIHPVAMWRDHEVSLLDKSFSLCGTESLPFPRVPHSLVSCRGHNTAQFQ